MTRLEAYRVLSKMWDDATPEQEEAINIAQDAIEFIDLMPNDMVAVVRCKDCKYWDGLHSCGCHKADENGTPIFMRESDFCSYGERRSE